MILWSIEYIMTARPLKYILNTDFTTLKNDSNTQTITLSLPATTLTAGTPVLVSTTATVGVSGAPMDFDINYSLNTNKYISNFIQITESTYSVTIAVFRSGANTVKVKASLYYGGPSPSITSTDRTVTVNCRTYIPPFA